MIEGFERWSRGVRLNSLRRLRSAKPTQGVPRLRWPIRSQSQNTNAMSAPPAAAAAAAPVMKAGAVVKRKKPAMLQATAAQMQSFVVCVSSDRAPGTVLSDASSALYSGSLVLVLTLCDYPCSHVFCHT